MKHKILLVDDEPANLRMLERLLAEEYTVLTATSGPGGLQQLIHHEIAVIVSDQRMPGMTGLEFLKKAAAMRFQTVRILLTGYTDVETVVEAINSGVVYKYITKPWSNSDLRQTLMRAYIERYETTLSGTHLEQENFRHKDQIKTTVRAFVDLALEMLSIKGTKFNAHSQRTAMYATAIGKRLDLTPPQLEQLHTTALLHEVANIRIPSHMLSRATPLGAEDVKTMQEHINQGVKLIAAVPELTEVAQAIKFQNDHYDGHASPNRLSGDQIPLDSRILAIADAYDEMREPNTGLSGFSHPDPLAVLQSAAGRKYDPSLVKIFTQTFDEDIRPPMRELLAA